jgi:hypothetical protein
MSDLQGLALPLAVVLVAGVGMGGAGGSLGGAAVIAVLAWWLHRRAVQPRLLPLALGPARALGLSAAGLVAGAIVVAAIAGALADLCTAHPAATWSLLAVGVAVGFGRRWAVLVAFALVPAAALVGDRFEAGGPEARGWAHSGPILGTHPFQSTAVVVDGHGPFDLSLNDYVEPDGRRGYGPEDLAVALESALHRIAQLHFSDGPARAHRAFAGATVEVRPVPQLVDPRHNPESTGLRVTSGTHGRGSSVSFGCPGALVDPRPRPAPSLMRPSCPSKYATEGNAGLGLTGRWPGYVEAPGQSRLALARSWGEAGPDAAPLERRLLAAALGLLALGIAVLGPRRGAASAGLGGTTAAAGLLLGFASLVAFVDVSSPRMIDGLPDPAGAAATFAVVLGALSVAGGSSAAEGRASAAGVVALLALAGAWAVVSPPAHVVLAAAPDPATLVGHAADDLAVRTGLDPIALEAVLGGALAVVLFAALSLVLTRAHELTIELLELPATRRWPLVVPGIGAVVLAAFFAPSTALVPAFVALAAVRSALFAAGRSAVDRAMHGLGIVLGLVALLAHLRAAPAGIAPVLAAVAAALVAVTCLPVPRVSAGRPGG